MSEKTVGIALVSGALVYVVGFAAAGNRVHWNEQWEECASDSALAQLVSSAIISGVPLRLIDGDFKGTSVINWANVAAVSVWELG